MTSRAPARDMIAPGDHQAIADAIPRVAEGPEPEHDWVRLVYRYPFNSPWVHAKARQIASRWFLPFWFLLIGARQMQYLWDRAPTTFAFDVRLYRLAAEAWLSGADPWRPTLTVDAADQVMAYAGPPPTLLPFILMAWIPTDVLVLAFLLASGAAALWTLRRLGLRYWWIAFPPIVEGIWVGNLNIFVIALLVAGGTLAGGIAGVLKVYAFVPLILLGRWRPLLVAAAILAVTYPVLPWASFIHEYPKIASSLASQAWGGHTSILTSPLAVAGGAIGLVLLGRQRAAWLAVPVLWPSTQLHYTVLALPAMTPFLAMFGAVTVPGALGLGVMTYAIWTRRDLVRDARARWRYVARIRGIPAVSEAPSDV